MKSIKKIIAIKPYTLTLEFNGHDIRRVDLKEKFSEWSRTPDSKFKELLNPDAFQKVRLNSEIESVYWENGIDLCPDVLYHLGEEKP